jgi:hypothetical protein
MIDFSTGLLASLGSIVEHDVRGADASARSRVVDCLLGTDGSDKPESFQRRRHSQRSCAVERPVV